MGFGFLRKRERPVWASGITACTPLWAALGLVILGPAPGAHGTAYYVDTTNPSCSNSGAGTESQPYCSISAAIAAHKGAGVTIVVKPGVYRELVNVNASGAAGNPFTFEALGSPVVIDGADDFSSQAHWASEGEDVYLAENVTWSPIQVFKDGARLTPSTAAPESLAANTFRWISGDGLYVNVGGDEPWEHTLLVGRRNNGFMVPSRSWVTIRGFTVVHTENRGIFVNVGSTDVVVSRDTVSLAGNSGILANNSQRIVIEECRTFNNALHGIALIGGTNGCTLRSNEAYGNADPNVRRANGIHLFSAPSNTLVGNRVHDNQDSGFHFGDGANNCTSLNNRSWNNGDHGYDHLSAVGAIHVHDVAFGNFKDGFSIEDVSTNARLYNCIAVDNGLTTNEFDLWVNTPSSVGFVSDYNIFWNSTSQKPIKFGTTLYQSIADYQQATGQDAHSLQVDPLFANGPAGDFHPMAGSPAIDAGHSGAPAWPPLDADGKARVNDPAIANSGAGPVPFADRGALEFLTDQAPVVTVPPTAVVVENDTVTVVVTVVEPDGDPIDSLTVANLPPGATFVADPGDTSGTLTWTPAEGQAGTYTVTFLASDAFTGCDSTVITVVPASALAVGPLTGPARPPRVAPNPVGDRARVLFGLSRAGPLQVHIYDLTGREVRALMDEAHAPPGEYDIPFDVGTPGEARLPSGLYFYRVQSAEGTARGRFVVVW